MIKVEVTSASKFLFSKPLATDYPQWLSYGSLIAIMIPHLERLAKPFGYFFGRFLE